MRQTNERPNIGQVIRSLRKEKGISQEDLAKSAHVDRTTLTRAECGKFKSLSVEKLEGVAAALGIDLRTLLMKTETMGESLTYRGHVSRVEFVLDYPDDGFQIVSLVPKRREFFFGKIKIQPQTTVASSKLPHPEQIFLHCLEGKIVLMQESRESLLKPGDYFAFSGLGSYETYNPDPLKSSVSLFITYPSFLPV